MKNIFILNHYAGITFFNNGGRHYSFSKYLKKYGENPVVFCSNSKHNSNSELYYCFNSLYTIKEHTLINVPYVFINNIPYKKNDIFRIVNMIQFYFNLIKSVKEYAKIYGKPDVIVASSAHLFTLLAGLKLAKIFNVNCICEIRDLWPESIVSYFQSISKNNILIKFLYYIEKKIYIKASALIFTMEGAYDYIVDKGWDNLISTDKIFYINNGVDLEDFENNKKKYKIDDIDLLNKDSFNIVYTGSIRKVNNISLLIDVAKLLDKTNIKFLIWGDGDEFENISNRIINENIHNVVLKGNIDKKYIPYIVSNADINIVHNFSSSIFKYGISFNKIFDYLAGNKPILCDFLSNYNPIVYNNAGIECDGKEIKNIVNSILYFYRLEKSSYLSYCCNAQNSVKQYDFEGLSLKLLDIIYKNLK